jgi:5-methylcytosine-specific restriction protein A
MKWYDGIDGDSIQRGGSYNKDAIGHEVCNFSNIGGQVYGYVQPTGQVNVEKLGAGKNKEYAKGVTVIWTAGPDSGGLLSSVGTKMQLSTASLSQLRIQQNCKRKMA